VKYWEIIADNLSKAGWNWGCVATINSNGQTIFVADAHRDDGKRFVVHADELLTAFVELESTIRAAERPEDGGAREITLDNCRGQSKSLLDYVIRQFHLIFGTAE
jgi:DNA-binding transcriptional LysR family regulator